MRLTQDGMETTIHFDDPNELADIYTHNKSLITKLDKLCPKSLDILSGEQRAELSKQAYQRFHGD